MLFLFILAPLRIFTAESSITLLNIVRSIGAEYMGIMGAAAVVGGTGLIGSLMQSDSASSAADAQIAAADRASQLQYAEFQQQQQNLQPWIKAGTGALGSLVDGLKPGGQFNTPFSMAQFQQDPGMNFQLQQGQGAIGAGAAARGMNMSPATMQALSSYNQGMANTSYQQAFNNYNTQMNERLGATESLANVGLSSTNNLNALGGQNASTIGGNIMGAGNAQAAGQVASGNAWGGALSGMGQNYLNSYYMNQLLGKGGAGAGGADLATTPNQFIDPATMITT
jgi:hypothetical protein